jgi:hypothetical protein
MAKFKLIIDLFSAAIAIILLLRLIFIFTDKGEEKWKRSQNWLVGFVIVSLSWTIVSQMFHYDVGEFSVKDNRDIHKTTPLNNTQDNNNNDDESNVNTTDVVLPNGE